MAAGGGFDSRSSSASVRSTRASRMGAGNSTERSCMSRVTSVSLMCSVTTPRSCRSRRSHNGSNNRASTNDSGSSPSIGHSRSSDASNFSSTSGRHQRTRLLAARPALPSQSVLPEAGGQIGGRKRGEIAERAKTPALDQVLEVRRVRWACAAVRGAWSWSRADQQRERQRRQRLRLFAARHDRQPGARVGQQNRCGRCGRHRDMHTQPGIGRRPAQLFADRSRLANQASQSADVERDCALAVRLDARRKIARELHERGVGAGSLACVCPSPLTLCPLP